MFRLTPAAMLSFLLAGCTVIPEPLEQSELTAAAERYADTVTADQEPITARVSLYEAMARALKYNLDRRVELMEGALRVGELDLVQYDMLPRLVASGGYDGRNNFSGATSESLLTGRTSLEPSTSSERDVLTANLSLSWDVLDFGLSYVRARQAADEVLIAEEQKRKVVNRIVEDVRTAYWRAVSAQRLTSTLIALEADVADALQKSRNLSRGRSTSPLTALTYQRELLEIKREVQNLLRELALSKLQLSALMNAGAGETYTLVVPEREARPTPLAVPRDQLIPIALENRPELREVGYQRRINAEEADAAYLELLPSLRGFLGLSYDSNDFLFNSDWVSWGAKVSWNMMKAYAYPQRVRTIEARDELLKARALALTMAIMTQVNVSYARYGYLSRELGTTAEQYDVQTALLDQIEKGHHAGRVSRQTLIRERMNSLVAEAEYDIAYADLQNAYANVYASVGLDPFSSDLVGNEGVAELAASLEQLWASRGDGVALTSQ